MPTVTEAGDALAQRAPHLSVLHVGLVWVVGHNQNLRDLEQTKGGEHVHPDPCLPCSKEPSQTQPESAMAQVLPKQSWECKVVMFTPKNNLTKSLFRSRPQRANGF